MPNASLHVIVSETRGPRRLTPKAAGIALCLAVLTACADGRTSIARNQLYGRYDVTEVQWGAGSGQDFQVVVRNNPTAMASDAFERKVIDSIQGKITYMNTNFTTKPGESARTQYRIEFFFNPPNSTNGFALCDPNRDLPDTVLRPGETYVLGAFCLRDKPLSEAFARRANAAPGTPEFEQLMSQTIRALLPQVQRGRKSPRCRMPAACG